MDNGKGNGNIILGDGRWEGGWQYHVGDKLAMVSHTLSPDHLFSLLKSTQDEQMDEQTDRHTDGWTDRCTEVCKLPVSYGLSSPSGQREKWIVVLWVVISYQREVSEKADGDVRRRSG